MAPLKWAKYLLLFLALCAHAAFAAHAYVQSSTHAAGSGGTTIVVPAITVTAGHTLMVAFQDNSSGLTPTVTTSQGDTVVSGRSTSYAGAFTIYSYYVLSAKGGSTSVTINDGAAPYNGVVDEYSGLSTYVGANDSVGSPGTNTIQSGNISFSGAQVPGMIWAVASDNSYGTNPTAGTTPIAFTVRSTPNAMATEDGTVPSAGNSQGIFSYSGGSLAIVLALGFKDAGGATCTHSGYTSGGAIAVPNGTSGSYVGKTGGPVTPDCSTIYYWAPTLGNFVVN